MNERQQTVVGAGVVAMATVMLPWAHSLFAIAAGFVVLVVGCFWLSHRVGRWIAIVTLVVLVGYFSNEFYVTTLAVMSSGSWSWSYFIQSWLHGSVIGLMLVGVRGVYAASKPTLEQSLIKSLERRL